MRLHGSPRNLRRQLTSLPPPALHPRLDWPADPHFLEPDHFTGDAPGRMVCSSILPVFRLADRAGALRGTDCRSITTPRDAIQVLCPVMDGLWDAARPLDGVSFP